MIKFIILGEPASKSNSRVPMTLGGTWARNEDGTVKFNEHGKRIREGGRTTFVKSEKARNYERDALLQIPYQAKQMLQGKVRITLRIFYASDLPDLDEQLVLDVLQTKFEKGRGFPRPIIRRGVIVNDRQVWEKHVFKSIDRANPRTEIEIEQLHAELFEVEPTPEPPRPRRAPRVPRVKPAPPVSHEPLPAKPF